MSQTRRHALSFAALICVLVASSRVTIVSARFIACTIPKNLTVVISDDERLRISQANLGVHLDEDTFTIDSYAATNSFEIRADRVTIEFTGYSRSEYGYEDLPAERLATEAERISEIYRDRLSGTARSATTENSEVSSFRENCRVVLLPTNGASRFSNSANELAREIRRLAELCVEREICTRMLHTGSENEMRRWSNGRAGQSLRVNGNVDNDKMRDCTNVQDTINMLVDIGIGQLMRNVATGEKLGTVALPDVVNHFSSGSNMFSPNGWITLVNGTFRDITTLKRRSNAAISHDGRKVTAAIQMRLDELMIEYKHYVLHYIMKMEGRMTGSVAGATVAAQFSANYEIKPCAITLDSLKVINLGQIRFELTGLGTVLNSLVRNLSEWLTAKFHKNIVSGIETKLGHYLQNTLSSFNCETFRAWN